MARSTPVKKAWRSLIWLLVIVAGLGAINWGSVIWSDGSWTPKLALDLEGGTQIILTRFDGGPVGLNTLAVSVGEEAETIESVVEPFLVRIGMLTRTPRGRVASRLAWKHFGISRDSGALFGDDL